MPTLDSTAKAAVTTHHAVAWFIFLDIVGDPLRVTTFGSNQTISGSGDSDLDGAYTAFGGPLIDVGDISNADTGSDTLSISLSGIVSINTALLNEIGDTTKWQGRLCRVWFRIYDPTGVTAQGAICSYYTGYMSSVRIVSAPKEQTIQLNAENYLAFYNHASFRSYLNQKDYDSADTSAAATIAAANGLKSGGTGAASGGGGGGSGPGGSQREVQAWDKK